MKKTFSLLPIIFLLVGCSKISSNTVDELSTGLPPELVNPYIIQKRILGIGFDEFGNINSFKLGDEYLAMTHLEFKNGSLETCKIKGVYYIDNVVSYNYVLPYGVDKDNYMFTPLLPFDYGHNPYPSINYSCYLISFFFGIYDEKMLETFKNK